MSYFTKYDILTAEFDAGKTTLRCAADFSLTTGEDAAISGMFSRLCDAAAPRMAHDLLGRPR
ncbi:hypothetical protein [Paracoccus laeviglucosivorans]|uniref:hypothetical protein n=1 Tax=Paracoccus laeviglucosivorans TaxID=1197861 RepID=UPI00115919D7|nr:hypothetical protein [Paracoccus laeviglucosivorans]